MVVKDEILEGDSGKEGLGSADEKLEIRGQDQSYRLGIGPEGYR